MKKTSLSFATLLLMLGATNTSAIEVAKHLSTIVEPKPIKRIQAKYPINAARNKREGWAKISFIIEKDGSVSNVIANETSGSLDFTKAAKKAVRQWKYQPAMENGEAIQQCVNSVRMNFSMGDNGTAGVSRKFKKKYAIATEALAEKDYARVELLLNEMQGIKHRHLSENNFMHTLAAEYAEAINNKEQQLFHLNQIHFHATNASEQHKLIVLNKRFQLAVGLNKFKLAYFTFNQLKKLDIAKPYMKKYEEVIASVETFIAGEQDIIVAASIKEKDYWSYRLVRNEFTLADVTGSLNKLDLRCANKRHVYTVENNNTWTIPKSWKNCSLYVYGEDNSSFKLVEHPIKS